MKKIGYAGRRFPPEIIRQAIRLPLRFTLNEKVEYDAVLIDGAPKTRPQTGSWRARRRRILPGGVISLACDIDRISRREPTLLGPQPRAKQSAEAVKRLGRGRRLARLA
jgi:hypothetical protein